MPSKLHKWALFYREQLHWSVIPINPSNKKPYIQWKEFSKSLPSVDQINEWWEKYPNANIGLCTGIVSGCVVVDIDEHECPGTIEYMKEVYIDKFPGDPNPPFNHTVRTTTPRGGVHWFFLYVPGMVSRRAIPHVDLKTDGGYVILPPSVGPGGREYEWVETPWYKDKRGQGVRAAAPIPLPYRSIFDKVNPSTLTGECKRCGTTKYKNSSEGIHSIHSIPGGEPVSEVTETPVDSGAVALSSISVPGEQGSSNVPNSVPSESVASQSAPIVTFREGSRDEDLFHIANTLVRGGTDIENVRTVLHTLGKNCTPPFSERDIESKVLSAINRSGVNNATMAREILEWIEEQEGAFSFREMDRVLGIKTKAQMSNRRKVIFRLKQEEVVEPLPGKSGVYRRVVREADVIDFKNVEIMETFEDFKLPLGEHRLVHILPKQIILIPGVFDAGKTTYMMNVTQLNQDKYPIHYFSSEMGPMEFKSRIQLFRRPLHEWNFTAKERSEDFQDVIVPDEVNIIDYLELHDNFYQVGGLIKRIFDRLTTGIAIIGIQKNPGVTNPLGGSRAMEKARLVVNLDHEKGGLQKATITKAKNWRENYNPRGLSRTFEIIDGSEFDFDGDWGRE